MKFLGSDFQVRPPLRKAPIWTFREDLGTEKQYEHCHLLPRHKSVNEIKYIKNNINICSTY